MKKFSKLTAKLLTVTYKSKITRFKLDEDPLQRRFYLLSFMNSLKYFSQFKETYMLLMDYPLIRGKDLPDYAKKSTLNLFHEYIDAHS